MVHKTLQACCSMYKITVNNKKHTYISFQIPTEFSVYFSQFPVSAGVCMGAYVNLLQ